MTGIELYFSIGLIVVFILLNVFYVVLMSAYKKGWINLPLINSKCVFNTNVSVIIACRNEAENIKKCLDSFINQTYPKHLFELIIVNDNSADNTPAIVEEYADKHSFIKLLNLQDVTGKRWAITKGVEYSKGDWIMTTDGDCWVEPTWLESVVSYYQTKNAKVILGPVKITKGYDILTKFQEIDFIGMIGIAGGSSSNGYPHVCNGANFSFEKKAFESINGFNGNENVLGGVDMFLLQNMNKLFLGQIHFIKSVKAFTYTTSMYTWKNFFNQRIRWASLSGGMIDKKIPYILGGVLLYNLAPLLIFISAFFIPQLWLVLIIHLTVKVLVDLTFFKPVLKFYNRESLIGFYPIAQVIHILYIVVVGILSRFSSFEWKGRKIQS